ncbi:predicted protein [Sclerotinia sclerotiorum 1980 UF-70]|uniref:Uncharacterized protein n=1 Tax=Sclerotinia sclerotiorum (strain ATCC 18683 / 1980 / Ss-1) TaxID=665079 RepID=A7F9X1_SCLS1|nr:predicted protein [Sclerotinia sclerotiorum 1980 UF-70]EDO00532.1 predicted protein [Sclerotinia sclerotiorum 1980 UF-70]
MGEQLSKIEESIIRNESSNYFERPEEVMENCATVFQGINGGQLNIDKGSNSQHKLIERHLEDKKGINIKPLLYLEEKFLDGFIPQRMIPTLGLRNGDVNDTVPLDFPWNNKGSFPQIHELDILAQNIQKEEDISKQGAKDDEDTKDCLDQKEKLKKKG